MKSRFKPHYLAAVMAAVCHSAAASDIEEVVVTAAIFPSTSNAINHPATVLAGDSLRNASSATLGETLNGQLGVSSASFGPGVGLPVIRGQSDNRVKVMQDSVGSMDASAASPDHAVTLEPLLATRIEVLRGPAALRYGSGAIGGVVNVLDNRIPEKRPDSLEGGAELRGNSVNNEVNGVVSLNGAAGDWVLHADALKRASDNVRIPGEAFVAGGTKTPEERANSGHHELLNTDADAQAATLGASYVGDAGFIGMSVNHLDNNYGVPPDSDERVRIDMHQTRVDLKGEVKEPVDGIEKITAHVGHANYEHTEMEDGVPGTRFTNHAYEGRTEIIHDALADWKGLVGLQYATSDFAAVGEEAFIPPSVIRNGGVFVIEETSFDKLTVQLGARSDFQHITPEANASLHHSSINLSGSSTWRPTEAHEWSFAVAQSQRAPSIEELLADGPHPATGSFLVGNPSLREETSFNTEGGYHWHGDNLHLSATLFYNRVSDFIYAKNVHQVIDDLAAYEYTQADATFKGFEAEAKYTLTPQWHLRVFADSVRATLDSGGDLPRITPRRLGTEWEYEQGDWNGGLTVAYSARQSHPGESESETASFTRVDLRLGYTLQDGDTRYTVFVKGMNLLNADIRNATSYLRDIAPEAGRNLQMGLRLTF